MGNAAGSRKAAAHRLHLPLEDYLAHVRAGEKYCWRCRAWHARSEFGVERDRPDGLTPYCLASKRVKVRRKPGPPKGRLRGWRVPARDGDRKQARARVNYLVQVGRLAHPSSLPCVDCGHVWSFGEKRHEYDHHLGYAAEHQLDVEPVCTECHDHRTRSRGENPPRRLRRRSCAESY